VLDPDVSAEFDQHLTAVRAALDAEQAVDSEPFSRSFFVLRDEK
jgi:hypothetical protein